MSATETGVPDLLRRFAPTPHSTRAWMKGFEIDLSTDDVEIVATMQRTNTPGIGTTPRASLRIRVIRDALSTANSSDVAIISAPPLTTLLLGTDSVLVLDCERREILGFLASSVSAERFADELLPTLLDRLENAETAQSIVRTSG